MKNIRFFLSENFHFLVVNFSVYLNRRVFVMDTGIKWLISQMVVVYALASSLQTHQA